jgi:hypothetical protein
LREVEARGLLGLPVAVGGVRLGTVRAVWVDVTQSAVGIEVDGAWRGDTRFVPLPAVVMEDGVLRTSPFAVLDAAGAAFYERNGARRVADDSIRDRFRGRAAGVEEH